MPAHRSRSGTTSRCARSGFAGSGPRPNRSTRSGSEWIRFLPTSTFDDPWVDAGRALVCVDVLSWPAASRPHMWKQPNVIAPSMDLYVAFHDAAPNDPWLLPTAIRPGPPAVS